MDWSLSFLGLYNYDSSVFDELSVPAGVDKMAVTSNLMLSTNTLAVVYPNPNTLKAALGMFSDMMMPSWQRAFDALQIQYEALYNMDIAESETRTPDLTHIRTPNLTSSGQNGGTDSTTTQVAAFNGNQLADREKTSTTLGTTNTVTTSGTETTTDTGTDTTERTRTGYQGRDPQQSIQAEIDLARNNIVKMIVQDIKCNFCVMVY